MASDADNRIRKDMMRSLFQGSQKPQQFLGFLARSDIDLDQLGAAERQGAGLVEYCRAYLGERLQRRAALHQNAGAGRV